MKLPNWLRRKKNRVNLAGKAVVRYDQLKQLNYWETTNAIGEDGMNMTGGGPLPLDPAKLPLGTVVKIYMPGTFADGK